MKNHNRLDVSNVFFLVILATLVLLCASLVSAYEIQFFHTDHLGSSAVVTDEDGDILWRTDYGPFGKMIAEEATGTPNDYTYTGKELDRETELYYYGARYYDPTIGRFISADRVEKLPNPYSYVNISIFRFRSCQHVFFRNTTDCLFYSSFYYYCW